MAMEWFMLESSQKIALRLTHMKRPQILLIDMQLSQDSGRKPTGNNTAPLPLGIGLSCLAQIECKKISVIEACDNDDLQTKLKEICKEKLHTIIFSGQKEFSHTCFNSVVRDLRKSLPQIRIGIASIIGIDSTDFDFIIAGTGRTAIIRLLRGDRLTGTINSLDEDLKDLLPVPEHFKNCNTVDAPPEKWLGGKTIEISQPWLGLLDHSQQFFYFPRISWIAKLVSALKNSEISAFHFRPSGLKPSQIHEFRSVMLNLQAPFAVSFFYGNFKSIEIIGRPLKQIWSYSPHPENLAELSNLLQQLKSTGIETGLVIDKSWAEHPKPFGPLPFIDRLEISDASAWPFAALKAMTSHYWAHNQRFFKRLFSIKNAAELINFMKTSYSILDIIFSSEKKGR